MKLKIAVLPGDGIGLEVTCESRKALNAVSKKFGHDFQYEEGIVGAAAIDSTGSPLPDKTLEICKNSDAIIFGAIGDPKYDHDPNAPARPEQGLLKLRKELGLFANIRPVKAYDALLDKGPLRREIVTGADFEIYRELTGGIYFGEKYLSPNKTIAYDQCMYTTSEITHIAVLAFKRAMQRRKKLTLVDKANVLETSRLWRRVVTEMSENFPEVHLDYLFVDNAAMQIILNPLQFDVILTENMFGDIISDEASVISGSIGLLASASVGTKAALFEPIHGSYPQAKGKGIANPMAAILSGAMLLDHFNLHEEADLVKDSVNKCLETGIVTPDLNKEKNHSTQQVGDHICKLIYES